MMTKDSNLKMDGAVRKASLLRILAVEPCTLYRLAELLRTSVRTLQRDIEECRLAGFAITMDEETKRFHLVSDYGLPSIDFTFSEILTVLISLQTSGVEYGPFNDDARRASMKIVPLFPPNFMI